MKNFLLSLLLANGAAVAATPSFTVVDKILIGGEPRWDYVYADSSQHRLYVSHGAQTEVIDTRTDKLVGTIGGTLGVHGIAIANDLGLGFTSNGRDNSVTVFELSSLKQRATISVGANPDAIVYDAATRRVVTFNGRSQDATVIDATRGEVVATVAVAGKPEFAQIGAAGNIYFNVEDSNELAVLDLKTIKLLHRYPVTPCESPSGLAIDDRQRLYSVCANKVMVITAPDGKQIGQAAIGAGPDGVAWLDGYAYSANGADGTISVVSETSAGKFETVATLISALGARTIAADATNHRLYLPTADFKAAEAGGKRQGLAGTFYVLVLERQ